MDTEQEELQDRLDVCANYLDLFERELTVKQINSMKSDINILRVQLRGDE